MLRQQNRFHSQFESFGLILSFYVTWTLFIPFLNSLPSQADAVTKRPPLWQIAATQTTNPSIQVSFQTITKGYRSGIRDPLQVIVRNHAEWDALWKKHVSVETNSAPPPAINFDKEMVVAVFLGEKNTGGYEVAIVGVEQNNRTLAIHYREKNPLPGSIAIQALTQPFHIIQVARDDNLTPEFRRAS